MVARVSAQEAKERRAVAQEIKALLDDANVPFSAARRSVIVRKMRSAPFSEDSFPLRKWARMSLPAYLGKPHPSMPSTPVDASTDLTSLEWHTLKHTADGGWAVGTTPAQYLQDIRVAVDLATNVDVVRTSKTYPNSQATSSADQAATRTPTTAANGKQTFSKATVDPTRTIIVIYDARRGCVCTGYSTTASEAEQTLARWKPRRTS